MTTVEESVFNVRRGEEGVLPKEKGENEGSLLAEGKKEQQTAITRRVSSFSLHGK